MNWYKHDTNATTDAKIKKLILKYGAEGYAVYFHCLELIASCINDSNITFELEHDAEIIADNLKIRSTPECSAIDKVNEIMRYIVELNLFEESDGRIFCFKMLKRLDTSMSNSKRFRELVTKAKESNKDVVMTRHDTSCKKRKEEKRREKNIQEEYKNDDIHRNDLFNQWWDIYGKPIEKEATFRYWCEHVKPGLYTEIIKHTMKYVENRPDPFYRKDPLNYLEKKIYNDEVITSKELSPKEQTQKTLNEMGYDK